MHIGFLGTGTIATAVVHGIAHDDHQISLSQRSADKSAALAQAFDNVTIASNQGVLDASDVVFLGLMAETAPDICAPLTFRADQQVISMMAGASLDTVATMVAPAQAAAIIMPFPGIAEGGSPLMMLGDEDLIATLFGVRNPLFALASDDELAAYLAAQAVLSPIARLLDDAASWLGPRVSDPAQAEAFLRRLVTSSLGGEMIAAQLIDALNTPGGYNQRLRLHMEQSGLRDALAAGLASLADDT